jgi:hypothetical protein
MEKEIMPGIYISDFRSVNKDNETTGDFDAPSVDEETTQYLLKKEVLEADIKEVGQQIEHLKRSNTILIEEYRTDPDPVYREAIEENLFVLTKKKKLMNV